MAFPILANDQSHAQWLFQSFSSSFCWSLFSLVCELPINGSCLLGWVPFDYSRLFLGIWWRELLTCLDSENWEMGRNYTHMEVPFSHRKWWDLVRNSNSLSFLFVPHLHFKHTVNSLLDKSSAIKPPKFVICEFYWWSCGSASSTFHAITYLASHFEFSVCLYRSACQFSCVVKITSPSYICSHISQHLICEYGPLRKNSEL